jgi:beta-N-acetylhexosaminidase
MTGFFEAAGGIGEGALKALNAGVDLLLISYDPDQYFYVMAALLKAEKQGEISRVRLEKSVERLNRSIKGLVNKYSGRCRS